MDEKDQGFTLIELLVVMIIIGILAAIAIPVFLNQRQRAVDSSMKSDARTIATEMETRFVDSQTYIASTGAASNPVVLGVAPAVVTSIPLSTGNLGVTTVSTDKTAFCVLVTRATTAQAGSQTTWAYVSNKGGLQPAGVITCARAEPLTHPLKVRRPDHRRVGAPHHPG
jgi:prepilin-type N-terminal cleavage/methylation domain-containing protein